MNLVERREKNKIKYGFVVNSQGFALVYVMALCALIAFILLSGMAYIRTKTELFQLAEDVSKAKAMSDGALLAAMPGLHEFCHTAEDEGCVNKVYAMSDLKNAPFVCLGRISNDSASIMNDAKDDPCLIYLRAHQGPVTPFEAFLRHRATQRATHEEMNEKMPYFVLYSAVRINNVMVIRRAVIKPTGETVSPYSFYKRDTVWQE